MTVSVNDFSRIITVERMAFILSKYFSYRRSSCLANERRVNGGQALQRNRPKAGKWGANMFRVGKRVADPTVRRDCVAVSSIDPSTRPTASLRMTKGAWAKRSRGRGEAPRPRARQMRLPAKRTAGKRRTSGMAGKCRG